MGTQEITGDLDAADLRSFITQLLHDLQALEVMIDQGAIESGVRRIGAEQELFLIDHSWRAAPVAMEILEAVNDPHFTTELGRFNLEINLDPLELGGDCLARMEHELNALLAKVRAIAHAHGAEAALTGILPTLRKSDLGLDNMTPKPRYAALNAAMSQARGGDYEFRLKGLDELILKHDSVMLEACCTSFQVHYQVRADEFAQMYNLAQAITAPLLAAATNSPLLFGRRLWRETRIPLFQQAVDTRGASHHVRERSPRVSFGQRWVEHSVLELFRDDLARFHVLLGAPIKEDSLQMLREGKLPDLLALRVHNGTVYRWNRGCFGTLGGKAHLRIENRVLPSGPTVLDEMSNAAFFIGLMSAGPAALPNLTERLAFSDAEENFLAAAQAGLEARFIWLDGKPWTARDLILQQLLPMAQDGLRKATIAAADIDRYLGVIICRVESGRTGSQWLLHSLASMQGVDTKDEIVGALTAATVQRQWEGKPVHEWPPAKIEEGRTVALKGLRIEEFMTTDLFTVRPEEPIDLVVNLMDWKHIRHLPVENDKGHVIGVVSWFDVVHHYAYGGSLGGDSLPVSAVMQEKPTMVPPETSVFDAIALMRRDKLASLLVVKDDSLIGIVTERDILNITAHLLERHPELEC
ncbi:MAG: CBS domain-containing protein [Deltaproteobacteria bacterium]|nr:CBS domain-containing protein [Deltaproteobacteria bacterium]